MAWRFGLMWHLSAHCTYSQLTPSYALKFQFKGRGHFSLSQINILGQFVNCLVYGGLSPLPGFSFEVAKLV